MTEFELIWQRLDEIKMITTISTKKALTVEEAATYMGMDADYVRRMAKTKKIKSYRSKTGRGIYLHKADLDNWMMYREVNTTEFLLDEADRIHRRSKN
jgi:excisionase family DNA binding protein